MLFLIWALNFVRTFFASVEMIIWFIFILQFVNVIYHIDWFAYINQWAPIVFKHCYQALEDTQIESWCPQPANVYSLLERQESTYAQWQCRLHTALLEIDAKGYRCQEGIPASAWGAGGIMGGFIKEWNRESIPGSRNCLCTETCKKLWCIYTEDCCYPFIISL